MSARARIGRREIEERTTERRRNTLEGIKNEQQKLSLARARDAPQPPSLGGVESPLKPTISVNVDDFETDEYIDDENGGGQGTTNANSFFPTAGGWRCI